MGLYLLSTIAARDFGWLGLVDMVERLEATFDTMRGMERLHGHYYNWYETGTLRPLEPLYVSSVDSGNLAGHLIALAQACRELIDRPLYVPGVAAGLEDALGLVREAAAAISDDRRSQTVTRRELDAAVGALGDFEFWRPGSDFHRGRWAGHCSGQGRAGLPALPAPRHVA